MTWWSMFGFALAVLPICLTPGVSFTLVTQRALDVGPGSGLRVIAGTSAGLLCHATLAGLGLSALVMSSSEAFAVVKFAGAAYLIGLGGLTLWRTRRGAARTVGTFENGAGKKLLWRGGGDLGQGFLGNVLNPKAAAVYLTLAPQFLHTGHAVLPQMLALGSAHVIVAAGWLSIWLVVATLSRRALRGPSFRRTVDRISGIVLVTLGLRGATAAR